MWKLELNLAVYTKQQLLMQLKNKLAIHPPASYQGTINHTRETS